MLEIEKLYDLLSLTLKKIENLVSDRDFEKLRNMSEEKKDATVRALKVHFPDMFDRDTLNVSAISEWKLAASPLTKNMAFYLENSENKEELVFLVRYLDSFLGDAFLADYLIDDDWHKIEYLNRNYLECGLCLLPWLKCDWEHPHRDASTSYSIYYYMKNFYYFHVSDLSSYRVNNILMPKDYFKNAHTRGELRIMVSPLTSEKVIELTEIYTRDNANYISVKPVEGSIGRKLQFFSADVLKRASFEEVDLLVYPEMLGTDAVVEQISHELDEGPELLDNSFPRLTICPTIWKKHRNSCKILDDEGREVCEQYKHHGVDMKQPAAPRDSTVCGVDVGEPIAKEDIESDRTIQILHCNGIGRIAVVICKDFLVTKYLRILAEKLRVSLILVPSFTARSYHFSVLAAKYADLDCNVIWVNTCSARWLKENSETKDPRIENPVLLSCQPGKKGMKDEKVNVENICGDSCPCMDPGICRQVCTHIFRLELDREVGL